MSLCTFFSSDNSRQTVFRKKSITNWKLRIVKLFLVYFASERNVQSFCILFFNSTSKPKCRIANTIFSIPLFSSVQFFQSPLDLSSIYYSAALAHPVSSCKSFIRKFFHTNKTRPIEELLFCLICVGNLFF